MHIRKIMDVLGPENLCSMEEKRAFCLGGWSKLFEIGANDLLTSVAPTTTSLQGKNLTSQEMPGEIKALAVAALKLNKIKFKELEEMRNKDSSKYDSEINSVLQICFGESTKLQNLVKRMLSLDPKNLPNMEEIRIKDSEIQASTNPISEKSSLTIMPNKKIAKAGIHIFRDKPLPC